MSLQSKAVVVLGMHRSGTSAMATALRRAGLFIGDTSELLPGDRSNEGGYYERRDVMTINESLLKNLFRATTASYRELAVLTDRNDIERMGWILGAFCIKAASETSGYSNNTSINEVIHKMVDGAGPDQHILIKDPRLSLCYPAWLPALPNPVFVMMVRDPVEVALSLYEREKLPPYLSHQLWEIYNSEALLVTHSHPRIIVNYADLLRQPDITLQRVLKFLEQSGCKQFNVSAADCARYIKPSLYHSRFDNAEPDSQSLFAGQDRLYRALTGETAELDSEFNSTHPGTGLATLDYGNLLLFLMLLDQRKTEKMLKGEFRKEIGEWKRTVKNWQQRMDRVNRHPVSGPILDLLRFIKRDPDFGR